MVVLQRSAQIESGAWRYDPLICHMRLGECWRKIEGDTTSPPAADGSDGDAFLAGRCADCDPVAHGETFCPA